MTSYSLGSGRGGYHGNDDDHPFPNQLLAHFIEDRYPQEIDQAPLRQGPLAGLANEIKIMITQHLPPSDLLILALLNSHFREVCIPALYRTVDLSNHNRGRIRYGPSQGTSFWSLPASFRTNSEPLLRPCKNLPRAQTRALSN